VGCTPLRMRRVRIFFLIGGGGGADALVASSVAATSANSLVDAIPYCRVMEERMVGAKDRHGREQSPTVIIVNETFI